MHSSDKGGRVWPSIAVIALIGCGALVLLSRAFGQRSRSVPPFPNTLNPPKFDPKTIPSLPPENLGADTIERFVRWVASVPVSETQRIRDQIAMARNDEVVVGALLAHVFNFPVRDFGRHQLLLSILGELGHPKAIEPLVRFVNSPAGQLVHHAPGRPSSDPATSYLDHAAALQSRAVEMLAAIRSEEALAKVLAIASEHRSRAVRLAALDAYIYNHDDSPEAMERARAAARPREARFVGIARLERDSDPQVFAAKVREFYERYPEERPPSPHPIRTCAQTEAPRERSGR
jgi:hypothetical protein